MRCVTIVERTVIMVTLTMIKRSACSDAVRHITARHFQIFKSSIELN
jgi:hypothetical protein